jgi:calcineurin-like phosphoesterase family protein
MNECIIENWNKVVSEKDRIIILGDFFMGQLQDIMPIFDRLNGNITLVKGNHDQKNRIKLLQDKLDSVVDMLTLYHGEKKFLCTHYPMITDNQGLNDGVYNLHGHTHSSSKWSEYPLCYHVGTDAHSFTPIAFEDIVKEIEEKENGLL